MTKQEALYQVIAKAIEVAAATGSDQSLAAKSAANAFQDGLDAFYSSGAAPKQVQHAEVCANSGPADGCTCQSATSSV